MKTTLLQTIKQHGKAALLVFATSLSGLALYAQTWGTQASFITDNINGVSFFEGGDEGIAVAANGRILKTTDGGLSWILQNSATVINLNAVQMISSDSAYVAGDSGVVLVTGDGGVSWTQLASGTSEHLSDVYVLNGNGFISGNNGTILKINGTTITASPSSSSANLSGVFVVNGSTAFAAGGGLLNSTLLATYNNGSVWTPLTTGTLSGLNAVCFVNDSTGYAVGNLGTIIKTTNTGSSWSTVSSGTSANLNAVSFITADSGYAVGAGGVVLRTTNAGSTWTTISAGVSVALNDLSFPANYEGYAVGSGGTIIKTCPDAYFDIMPNDSICVNTEVTFTNLSHNGAANAWIIRNDTVGTDTDYSDVYDSAGIYTMKLSVSNGTCAASYSRLFYIADVPLVNLGPDTSICSTCTITLNAGNPGSGYIWYRDGVATGIVTQTNTVGVAGTYSVKVTTRSGCEAWDSIVVNMTTGVADLNNGINHISVHPNPNNRQFTLGFTVAAKQSTEVKIADYTGTTVYSETISDLSGAYAKDISLERFSAGIYFINISSNGRTQSVKVIAY